MLKRTLIFWLFFFSSVTQAGEAAELSFMGFAKDGQHLAFEQYGVMDGSGGYFSYLYLVNVPKNSYAVKPILSEIVETEQTLIEFRREVRSQHIPQLEKYDIFPDNHGQHVISHLFSDVGVDPRQVQFNLRPPLQPLISSTFTVRLEEVSAEGEAECFGMGEPKRFTLSVTHDQTNSTEVLQVDKGVPSSRGCPLAYRIQDVYVYNREYIAVFLNMITPGFEGQSMRFLVVTGRLPTPKPSEEVKG